MDTKQTFNDEAKIYEITSRQVTPYYDEALAFFVNTLPKNSKTIVDFCCGTGILTDIVAEKFPNAKIVGVDFSSGMLAVAKSRFKENKNIKFIISNIIDTQKLSKIKNCDLAISSFGIHNIHGQEEKIKATKNIAATLASGGTIAICDYIKGKTKKEQTIFEAVQKQHLLKSFDKEETQNWINLLKEEDEPETWETNKIILEKAGFGDIKLVWQKNFLAIWQAKKR